MGEKVAMLDGRHQSRVGGNACANPGRGFAAGGDEGAVRKDALRA